MSLVIAVSTFWLQASRVVMLESRSKSVRNGCMFFVQVVGYATSEWGDNSVGKEMAAVLQSHDTRRLQVGAKRNMQTNLL